MKQVKHYFSGSNENAWARGCSKCKYGIASSPELTGTCELYLERLVQAMNGDITFCDCKAGVAYRSGLLNRRLILLDEAKRDPLMASFAERKTHPDIEQAERALRHSYSMAPPIRFVELAEPKQPELEPA